MPFVGIPLAESLDFDWIGDAYTALSDTPLGALVGICVAGAAASVFLGLFLRRG